MVRLESTSRRTRMPTAKDVGRGGGEARVPVCAPVCVVLVPALVVVAWDRSGRPPVPTTIRTTAASSASRTPTAAARWRLTVLRRRARSSSRALAPPAPAGPPADGLRVSEGGRRRGVGGTKYLGGR